MLVNSRKVWIFYTFAVLSEQSIWKFGWLRYIVHRYLSTVTEVHGIGIKQVKLYPVLCLFTEDSAEPKQH